MLSSNSHLLLYFSMLFLDSERGNLLILYSTPSPSSVVQLSVLTIAVVQMIAYSEVNA